VAVGVKLPTGRTGDTEGQVGRMLDPPRSGVHSDRTKEVMLATAPRSLGKHVGTVFTVDSRPISGWHLPDGNAFGDSLHVPAAVLQATQRLGATSRWSSPRSTRRMSIGCSTIERANAH